MNPDPIYEDHVEYGDSGLVSLPGGGYKNKWTGEFITEDGKVFLDGELIYDPDDEKGME